MKIAIIGSRNLYVDHLEDFLPKGCTEIVSGGARGIDQSAAEFARANAIRLTEFLPQYSIYGKAAPILRNRQIVDYADHVLAFWDGKSSGTQWVIRYCEKIGKPYQVIISPTNR